MYSAGKSPPGWLSAKNNMCIINSGAHWNLIFYSILRKRSLDYYKMNFQIHPWILPHISWIYDSSSVVLTQDHQHHLETGLKCKVSVLTPDLVNHSPHGNGAQWAICVLLNPLGDSDAHLNLRTMPWKSWKALPTVKPLPWCKTYYFFNTTPHSPNTHTQRQTKF